MRRGVRCLLRENERECGRVGDGDEVMLRRGVGGEGEGEGRFKCGVLR